MAVGKSLEQAAKLSREVRAFENSGAYAVELEVIPTQLAKAITDRTSMLTISLGSGSECDAQYLFSADLLGENRGHFPRHAKAYRNFAAERDRLQVERVAAYREYIEDVTTGLFPASSNTVKMDESVLDHALKTLDDI
jgi:3-methyl-2-oxobutanoate hydroxymethyltransferase